MSHGFLNPPMNVAQSIFKEFTLVERFLKKSHSDGENFVTILCRHIGRKYAIHISHSTVIKPYCPFA